MKDINIAPPISWQIIGFLLFSILASSIVFVTSADYSRSELVPGLIMLEEGVATITPSRPGLVEAVLIRDNQKVLRGQPLLKIRVEEGQDGAESLSEIIGQALNEQEGSLNNQVGLLTKRLEAERLGLLTRIGGIVAELEKIDQQISDQRTLVELAKREFDLASQIAEKGFVSRRDLQIRETTFLSRKQQQSEMEQAKIAKIALKNETNQRIQSIESELNGQISALEATRSQIKERQANAKSIGSYIIKSPIAGTVTALTASETTYASLGTDLLLVVPAEATRIVRLDVPNSAIGFLKVGQSVRISVDAFPYQKFGTIQGRVLELSSAAPTNQPLPNKSAPQYLALVELEKTTIAAFGSDQKLLPGMSISARIITRQQSLFEWLFEPLYAVYRRP